MDVNHHADVSIEVNRGIRSDYCSYPKYTLKLYDRPSAPFELNIQMLKHSRQSCTGAFHYKLRRARNGFLTRCIGWQKSNHTDQPICSNLDTLVKMGYENIVATLRKPDPILWGIRERIGMGRVVNDFIAFGIHTDKRTIAALDGVTRKKTGGTFPMIKWIAVERARALWHAVIRSNVVE